MILGHSLIKNLLKNSYVQLSSFRVIWEKPGTFWTPNGQYNDKSGSRYFELRLPLYLFLYWYVFPPYTLDIFTDEIRLQNVWTMVKDVLVETMAY